MTLTRYELCEDNKNENEHCLRTTSNFIILLFQISIDSGLTPPDNQTSPLPKNDYFIICIPEKPRRKTVLKEEQAQSCKCI